MWRLSLSAVTTAALIASGSGVADAGDRSSVSFRLSLGGNAASYSDGYYGNGHYGNGYDSPGRGSSYAPQSRYDSRFDSTQNFGFGNSRYGNRYNDRLDSHCGARSRFDRRSYRSRGDSLTGFGYGRSYGRDVHTPAAGHAGHYDFHAPEVVRHGDHLDVIPGHYDYHGAGH
ncbi:hypothetical protein [Alienimonas chondri]|uniref:Uncharacterized protein n=1 Tax=Alienimonas chondri TaxID=2681879 RepID=A0ABX1VDW8_9PLAN|nr:hypothetical protein [Alienimonas chondri]NNJ25983.1 hypothetical protein [Alienimonas chondri]